MNDPSPADLQTSIDVIESQLNSLDIDAIRSDFDALTDVPDYSYISAEVDALATMISTFAALQLKLQLLTGDLISYQSSVSVGLGDNITSAEDNLTDFDALGLAEFGAAFAIQKVNNVSYYTNVAPLTGALSSAETLKSWCLPMGQTMEAIINLSVFDYLDNSMPVVNNIASLYVEQDGVTIASST
jgi:hypothetical protein